ncbi:NeuD/PglB/VioB family sugar acetyltransferase [Levilinea saccharolytica]|uniref:Sugar O-acyltransferase, sialic acid O-acetyltransferase NeuD family n=1 Tax=Levilinea saccharolytica TaxID=229921 RepID=A0A0M9U3C9_9CHLR|nr:NeuD/PglB/VioB family sugar acetyltransferase [Levilinea saccharolytica]GAP19590.1 sugar O-acyltransferase, sialic acid O-acetyltransferase NeuD family [Levilinea saccharolytica]
MKTFPESPKPQTIVVLGAAGSGIQIAESVERLPGARLAGFLDDAYAAQGSRFDLPVLGSLQDWRTLPEDVLFLNSLYTAKKMRVYRDIVHSLGIPAERWATVVDPNAVLSPRAQVGRGVYVGPGVIVQPQVVLEDHVCILGNSYVAHDCHLERYACCANSVSLTGNVHIQTGAYLGANVSVRVGLQIGAFSTVGMGAVVLADIPPGEVWAGNPARRLRTAEG